MIANRRLVLRSRQSTPTMSSYASAYPNVEVDPAIKQYFEKFYQTSDTPDAHQQYADSFTNDATLIMASKKCQGNSGMF